MTPVIDGGTFREDRAETADTVVVGSGAGGAVVACELAEAGRDVLLLEEGREFSRKDFNRRPVEMVPLLYRDAGLTSTIGLPVIPVPLGRTLGGTTTINSGTCLRTPDGVLEGWGREFGLPDVTPAAMEPYFARVEQVQNVQPVKEALLGQNARLFKRGADKLGWGGHPLHRNVSDECRGCGVCCFGCPSDAKLAMNLTFIPRARAAGARVWTQARMTEVIIEGGRAVGVEARLPGGHALRVRAKTVILACGTFHTAAFLLQHKLANSSGLVGRGLTIHPATRIAALFDEVVDGWQGVPQGYGVDRFRDEGIMLEGIQGPPGLIAPILPFVGTPFQELVRDLRKVATFGGLIKDGPNGRVRSWRGKPLVTYFMSREDSAKAQKMMGLVAEAFLEAGAKRVLLPVMGFPEIRGRDDLERFRRTQVRRSRLEMMAFHPLGTCRMGTDRERSVVGPYGETHDVPGLWIADGSVVPTSLGVNPQITIMSLAMRTARAILASGPW